MIPRSFVLLVLTIMLCSACANAARPDLVDSATDVGTATSASSTVAGVGIAAPKDLAFATDSGQASGAPAGTATDDDPIGAQESSPADTGPDAASASSPSDDASAAPTSPEGVDDRPASGDTSEIAGTDTSADATTDTATAPGPIEFVVAANAALAGVELGSEASTALDRLEASLGAPDHDSGWYQGCPLDGDHLNERLVQWGDLNAYFYRSNGPGQFTAWGFDLRIPDGGFPELELIVLPGGSRLGDPINEVAAAAGLNVVADEDFGINRVGGQGFEIVSDPPLASPAWGVFVPAIPVCE